MPASWQPSTTAATWTTAPPKTTWPTLRRSVNWHRDTPGLRFWRMTEYRRRQAAARFRWGSDSQHLCTVLLKEKAATPTGIKQRGGQTGRRVGPGGKEVCIQYNHGKCSYGPRCNFEHVCLLCLQAHPQSDHRQQQATAKQE